MNAMSSSSREVAAPLRTFGVLMKSWLHAQFFIRRFPIVSGVGHETDFTIADLVADLRAATPTAAAEIALPSTSEIMDQLNRIIFDMNQSTLIEQVNHFQTPTKIGITSNAGNSSKIKITTQYAKT